MQIQSTSNKPNLQADIFKDKLTKVIAKVSKKFNLNNEETKVLERTGLAIYNSRLVNTVCPIGISKKIDINKFYLNARKKGYNIKRHKKFTGLSITHNLDDTKFTAIYFSSGKINLVGLNMDEPEKVNNIIDKLRLVIAELIEEPLVESLQITRRIANKVVSTKIKEINLNYLHLLNKSSYWKKVKYQDAIFPGSIIKNDYNNASCLFFKTGSLIITGVKNRTILQDTTLDLVEKLGEYIVLRKNFLDKQ